MDGTTALSFQRETDSPLMKQNCLQPGNGENVMPPVQRETDSPTNEVEPLVNVEPSNGAKTMTPIQRESNSHQAH